MKGIIFDDMGRKFLFAIFFSMLGFILVLFKYSSANDWFTFIQWISGMFIIGNGADKVIEKFKSQESPKE